MKFLYHLNDKQTIFEAVPENAKEYSGFRGEALHIPITLAKKKLIFDYRVKNQLHPDIIALICLTAFYPYIKYSVTFPFPVSSNFKNALNKKILPQFEVNNNNKIDEQNKIIKYQPTHEINVTNVDCMLKPYSGNNTVIAYGGGIDSTMLSLLLPEIPIIHCVDRPKYFKTMNEWISKLPNKKYIHGCNIREISDPFGYTGWANSYLVPLLLSSELDIKNILNGDTIDMSRVLVGSKYRWMFNYIPYSPYIHNHWVTAYRLIGIELVSPLIGCSELMTSKIVYNHNLYKDVLFCQRDNGKQCYKCDKCFRKMLQFSYHGNIQKTGYWNQFPYDSTLINWPLFHGHIYMECIKKLKNLPFECYKYTDDLKSMNTSQFNKIYPESFDYLPEDIKWLIMSRLTDHFQIMNDSEIKIIKNQNVLPPRKFSAEMKIIVKNIWEKFNQTEKMLENNALTSKLDEKSRLKLQILKSVSNNKISTNNSQTNETKNTIDHKLNKNLMILYNSAKIHKK